MKRKKKKKKIQARKERSSTLSFRSDVCHESSSFAQDLELKDHQQNLLTLISSSRPTASSSSPPAPVSPSCLTQVGDTIHSTSPSSPSFSMLDAQNSVDPSRIVRVKGSPAQHLSSSEVNTLVASGQYGVFFVFNDNRCTINQTLCLSVVLRDVASSMSAQHSSSSPEANTLVASSRCEVFSVFNDNRCTINKTLCLSVALRDVAFSVSAAKPAPELTGVIIELPRTRLLHLPAVGTASISVRDSYRELCVSSHSSDYDTINPTSINSLMPEERSPTCVNSHPSLSSCTSTSTSKIVTIYPTFLYVVNTCAGARLALGDRTHSVLFCVHSQCTELHRLCSIF